MVQTYSSLSQIINFLAGVRSFAGESPCFAAEDAGGTQRKQYIARGQFQLRVRLPALPTIFAISF